MTPLHRSETQAELRELRSLFEHGQSSICLLLLRDDPVLDEAFILRIRCLLRLEYWNEVVRPHVLARVTRLTGFTKLEAVGLIATACYRAGMPVPAERYMQEAHELADELGATVEQKAELLYFDALRAWSAKEYDRTEDLAQQLLLLPRWNARAEDLLAWVAAGRGDLVLQLKHFKQAIESPQADAWERVKSLCNFAELSYELYEPGCLLFLDSHASSFPWTEDMGKQKFYIFEDMGWLAALAGYRYKSIEYFCRAEQAAAGDPMFLTIIYFDKACLEWFDEQHQSAQDNLSRAIALATEADFKNDSPSRYILLHLAILSARMGRHIAAANCLRRYESIATKITPLKAYGNGDARLAALEAYAAGWVNRVQGKDALPYFLKAYGVYKDLGFVWRAVLVAASIAEISLEHREEMLAYAIQKTETRFPQAFFASIVRSAERSTLELTRLSPTKQAIAREIVRGTRYRDIALKLNRSERTVTNHVQDLFKLFSPHDHSRGALANVLRSLGVE